MRLLLLLFVLFSVAACSSAPIPSTMMGEGSTGGGGSAGAGGGTPIGDLRFAARFDEGTGTTTVDDVEQLQGTIEGASWQSDTPSGAGGFSLTFHACPTCKGGADDDVYFGMNRLGDLAFPFTAFAWVKPGSLGSIPFTVLATDGAKNYSGIWLRIRTDGVEASWGDGIQSTSSDHRFTALAPPLPDDGQWHAIAVVFRDYTTTDVFVDGAKQNVVFSGQATSFSMGSGPFFIGRSLAGDGFIGSIDDVEIFGHALSGAQIKKLSAP